MSLRFETKAILDNNEEKPIQSSSKLESGNSSTTYVPPIWQQLQANQQSFQESYDEETKERFRGTKLLDEEDVEYLSSLDEARIASEEKAKREEEDALLVFRLQREQKLQLLDDHKQQNEEDDTEEKEIKPPTSVQTDCALKRSSVPVIVVRKVKRKLQDAVVKQALPIIEEKSSITESGTNAFSSLIGCYDSDESG